MNTHESSPSSRGARSPRSMRRLTAIAVASGLAVVLLAGIAVAQSSARFGLWWNVIPGGGGWSRSTGHQVAGSGGQAAVGVSSGGHFRIASGFWTAIGGGASPTVTPTVGPGTPSATPTAPIGASGGQET